MVTTIYLGLSKEGEEEARLGFAFSTRTTEQVELCGGAGLCLAEREWNDLEPVAT
jgi:hypothetical protein